MHHLCCGVFFKLGSLHIEQYIWSLSLSYFIHEPYKWSHLDWNLRFSTVLSSTLGSGVCLLSSTWDMTSHTLLFFSCSSRTFPQKISRVLCLGSSAPTLSFLDLGGGISERPWSNSCQTFEVLWPFWSNTFGPVIFAPKISFQNTLFCSFCS